MRKYKEKAIECQDQTDHFMWVVPRMHNHVQRTWISKSN